MEIKKNSELDYIPNEYWVFDTQNHFRPKITKEVYAQKKGPDFLWELIRDILDSSYGSLSKYGLTEKINMLSFGQKSLVFWWILDGEVTNGGFEQFYANNKAHYIPAILNGLTYIQDKEMVKIVVQADKAGRKGHYGRWPGLDMKYYKIREATISLFEKYIREHPDEFCMNEDGKEFESDPPKSFLKEEVYKETVSLANKKKLLAAKTPGPVVPISEKVEKTYHNNGNLKAEYTLINDKIDGPYKIYDEEGCLHKIEFYKKGKKTKDYEKYYKNGQREYSYQWDETLKLFVMERYYESGARLQRFYRDAKSGGLTGKSTIWYRNGRVKTEEDWEYGRKVNETEYEQPFEEMVKQEIEESLRKNDGEIKVEFYKLKHIPDEIDQYPEITHLIIDCPDLAEINPRIFNLPNLRKLELLNLSVLMLPTGMGKLQKLKRLKIWRCKLMSIPQELQELHELEELEITQAVRITLPEAIGNLKKLKQLNISYSTITAFPDSMKQLASLTHIELYWLDIYPAIPDFVFECKDLEELDIRHNQIEEIPQRIMELTHLKVLKFKPLMNSLVDNSFVFDENAKNGLPEVVEFYKTHTGPFGADRSAKFKKKLKLINAQLKIHQGSQGTIDLKALSREQKVFVEEFLLDHLPHYFQIALGHLEMYFEEDRKILKVEVHAQKIEIPAHFDSETKWNFTMSNDDLLGPVVVFNMKGWTVEDSTLVG